MKKLSFAVALAFAAMGAQALTMSGGSFSNAQTTTEIAQTGTLNLFDSSLGTLTDVELSIDGAMTTFITLSNSAAQAQTVKADGTVNLFFTSTIGPLNAAFAAPALVLASSTGFQNIASGASVAFGPLVDSQATTLNAALDAFIASFSAAGGGTFDLGCSSLSGLALTGGGGNVAAVQSTTAGCGASITYTYEPTIKVSEPASLALVGLALAAAGVASRRKSV